MQAMLHQLADSCMCHCSFVSGQGFQSPDQRTWAAQKLHELQETPEAGCKLPEVQQEGGETLALLQISYLLHARFVYSPQPGPRADRKTRYLSHSQTCGCCMLPH
jgi:hypothetical protein